MMNRGMFLDIHNFEPNKTINPTQNSVGGFSAAGCLRGLFLSLDDDNIGELLCEHGCQFAKF